MTGDRARELLAAIDGVTVEAGGRPMVVRVPAAQWRDVARFSKDTLGCAYFCFETAIRATSPA